MNVDGVPVTALIDTGAHVSVMSAQLRHRLKKVLTPAPSPVLRVADGGTPAVIGMCPARVSVADHHTSVLFYVLEHCPHDLILGLDFLSAHSALIDCSAGVVQLALPVAIDPLDSAPIRLCSTEHIRLPHLAVTYIGVSPVPPIPDGDYIVSPNPDVLLSHNVAFPHTVITITENTSCLPLVNFVHKLSRVAYHLRKSRRPETTTFRV